MKFSIKDFFSTCDQIRSFTAISSKQFADTRMFHDKISLFWWNKYVTSGKWLKRSFKGLWTW